MLRALLDWRGLPAIRHPKSSTSSYARPPPVRIDPSTRWGSLLTGLAARLAGLLVNVVSWTCRFRIVEGAESLAEIVAARRPVIVCLWHNRAVLGTVFFRDRMFRRGLPMTVLVSQSQDGELLARFILGQGASVVRGSSTRGGRQALRGALRAIAEEGSSPIVVPDGPVGPAYQFKPGALQLARLSGAPIVLMGFAARRSKVLGSWDRLVVPRPFTRIAVALGAPEPVARDLGPEALEGLRADLEAGLVRLNRRAEEAVGASDPVAPGAPVE